MPRRPFNSKSGMKPCPQCGNTTSFVACSIQCPEGRLEVWIECNHCGHHPHEWNGRFKDVWESLDEDAIRAACGCWNDVCDRIENAATAQSENKKSDDTAGLRHEKSMKQEPNTEAAETAQITDSPAVDQFTACSACGGCTMLPGREEDDDVMNTPCWKCNEHAKACGNCWHACQPFNVPPLGDHVHCNHPVIEVRDSPPYNHGWGTLRNARETCPHWMSAKKKADRKIDGGSCQWSEDEDGTWDTACGEKFYFDTGGPNENKANWCLYCGNDLVPVPFPHNAEVCQPKGEKNAMNTKPTQTLAAVAPATTCSHLQKCAAKIAGHIAKPLDIYAIVAEIDSEEYNAELILRHLLLWAAKTERHLKDPHCVRAMVILGEIILPNAIASGICRREPI